MKHNAISYLGRLYPGSVTECATPVWETEFGKVDDISFIISYSPVAGTKQRVMVIPDFSENDIEPIFDNFATKFEKITFGMLDSYSNDVVTQSIGSEDMPFAARVIIYTNAIRSDKEILLDRLKKLGVNAMIVQEAEMYQSAFISFGGPDEAIAARINLALIKRGVRKTWFFPIDKVPGQKLHRMMSEGIENYDRCILICSENSLSRPGVLNEIERVLEKEAAAGGAEILIPVTIDNFVFDGWAPARADVARQVKSRVISVIEVESENSFDQILDGIVHALTLK